MLDWFSFSVLLICSQFRSILPNQYLISERSAGLLLHVPWRIVKTHWPSSPFNLFTPKIMSYWIGLRPTEVQPMLYYPESVLKQCPKQTKILTYQYNKAPDNTWHESLIFLHLFLIPLTTLWASRWPKHPPQVRKVELTCTSQDKWTLSYWPLQATTSMKFLPICVLKRLFSYAFFSLIIFPVLPLTIHYKPKCTGSNQGAASRI